jgi:hypothetical protein
MGVSQEENVRHASTARPRGIAIGQILIPLRLRPQGGEVEAMRMTGSAKLQVHEWRFPGEEAAFEPALHCEVSDFLVTLLRQSIWKRKK